MKFGQMRLSGCGVSDPCGKFLLLRKENSMNLQEFQAKVQADKIAQAEALRKINLAKSQAFLSTLKGDK
jgi:hypothetical protein